MANEVAVAVERVLGPLVGSVLAGVSVQLESKRIGKNPDTLSSADLPALSENLAVQLRLLVGREMAEAAAARVRALS